MLNDFLEINAFQFVLLFTRLGTALSLFPGFGGALTPVRTRLLLALGITVILLPILGPDLPAMPKGTGDLALLVIGEASIGVFLGMISQLLMLSLNIASTFMSFQIGLTNAMTFDAIAESQGQLLTGFMSNLAIVMILASDTHHLLLRALVESYSLFVPGQGLPLGEFSQVVTEMLDDSFRFGLQLSAPLVVFGLVFYSGLGLMAKLTPAIPIFQVVLPLQILFGISVLMLSLPAVMMLFLRAFGEGLGRFLGG